MKSIRNSENEVALDGLKLTFQVKTTKEIEDPALCLKRTQRQPSTFQDFCLLVSNNNSYSQAENDVVTSYFSQFDISKNIWDELLDIHHRCFCNAFSISLEGELSGQRLPVGRAIYIKSSFFNHSCRPNVFFQQKPGTPVIQFLPFGMVRQGEELTVSYMSTMVDFLSRQVHLQEDYKFVCRCPRCEEDKEFFQDCSHH